MCMCVSVCVCGGGGVSVPSTIYFGVCALIFYHPYHARSSGRILSCTHINARFGPLKLRKKVLNHSSDEGSDLNLKLVSSQ